MKRLLQSTALTCSLLVSSQAYSDTGKAFPAAVEARYGTIYASQSGRPTMDRGEGGGNPFASALIELLNRPSLTLNELVEQIGVVTQRKSGGYQLPDVSDIRGKSNWTIKPGKPGRNIALVATFSRYTAENVPSLPGAERDRVRVSDALRAAGFTVVTRANPTMRELDRMLRDFAVASKNSDVAFVYVTGHGFEAQGRVYLAPGSYYFSNRGKPVGDGAIDVRTLGKNLKAKQANLVFYGGCRTRSI